MFSHFLKSTIPFLIRLLEGSTHTEQISPPGCRTFALARDLAFFFQVGQQPIKCDLSTYSLKIYFFRHCYFGEPVFKRCAKRCTGFINSVLFQSEFPSAISAIACPHLRLFSAAWICLLLILPRRVPSLSALRRMSRDISSDCHRSSIVRRAPVTGTPLILSISFCGILS